MGWRGGLEGKERNEVTNSWSKFQRWTVWREGAGGISPSLPTLALPCVLQLGAIGAHPGQVLRSPYKVPQDEWPPILPTHSGSHKAREAVSHRADILGGTTRRYARSAYAARGGSNGASLTEHATGRLTLGERRIPYAHTIHT